MTRTIRPHECASLFLAHKRSQGVAETTLASYRRSLDMFLATPGLPENVSDLDERDALNFTAALSSGRLSPGGINAYQRPVWVWFRWMFDRRYLTVDIPRLVRRYKVPAPKRRTASDDVREKLLKVALDRAEHPRRNAAIIEVLWSTGARRTELAHVQLSDVDLEAGTIRLSVTKTGVPRTVGLGVQARLALEHYFIDERGRKPGPLFRSRLMQPMSSNAIRCVLRSLAESAGVEVASHDFRRACAARLLRQGVAADDVARQLGHSTLSMTLMYGEEGRTEKALRAFHDADSGVIRLRGA